MSIFSDANWHPIVMVAHRLGLKLSRLGGAALCECPCGQGKPPQCVFLHQKPNTWWCRSCRLNGDLLDLVAIRRKCSPLAAAYWIVRACRVLPEPKDATTAGQERPRTDTPASKD